MKSAEEEFEEMMDEIENKFVAPTVYACMQHYDKELEMNTENVLGDYILNKENVTFDTFDYEFNKYYMYNKDEIPSYDKLFELFELAIINSPQGHIYETLSDKKEFYKALIDFTVKYYIPAIVMLNKYKRDGYKISLLFDKMIITNKDLHKLPVKETDYIYEAIVCLYKFRYLINKYGLLYLYDMFYRNQVFLPFNMKITLDDKFLKLQNRVLKKTSRKYKDYKELDAIDRSILAIELINKIDSAIIKDNTKHNRKNKESGGVDRYILSKHLLNMNSIVKSINQPEIKSK